MIRVVHNGIEIFCETVDETMEIVSRLSGQPITAKGSPSSPPHDRGNSQTSSRWTVHRFTTFISQLQDQQRKLLRSLVTSPDGQTDTALRQHLGLSSNKAFGPILTGISRRAKKAGVSLGDVLSSERITVGNERVLEFKAAPQFANIAKEAGGIK
jgi:hypothetical protein